MWAFCLDCAFRMLIGWAGKLQSHGYDKISRAYVANQSARKTLLTGLVYILNTNTKEKYILLQCSRCFH